MNECVKCHGTGKAACSKCGGKMKVKCNKCGGSGTNTSTCPVCHRGNIKKSRWINCKKCHGTGQLLGDWVECSYCGLSTLRELHPVGSSCHTWETHTRRCPGTFQAIFVTCPDCDGRGQVKETYDDICPNCHGEWQKDAGPCKECNGTGKMTCPTCKGTGKETCSLCKGTGSVDIEAMCKGVINITEEEHCGHKNRPLFMDRITPEIAVAIFDAAHRGVGIAAWVASYLCDDYAEFAGGKNRDDYLDIAADAGNMCAQFDRFNSWDEEGVIDDENNWEDLKKSAAQGFAPALEQLAYLYSIVKSDHNKALEYWKKILVVQDNDTWNQKTIRIAELHVKYLPAIINHDYNAMLALGKSLLKFQWMGNPPYTCVNTDWYGEFWLEKAESMITFDTAALRTLAGIYLSNKNKEKANEISKQLADTGDALSQSALGERLRCGEEIDQDYRQALIYLYRAAEQGRIEAIRRLAHLYRDGAYVQENRKNANELYVRAAKSDDGWSLYEIGKCYLEGNEVKKDEVEAKRLLTLAANKGIKSAATLLTKISPSIKYGNKGPSGIIVGKADKSHLPKFLKRDYDLAVAGKPAWTKKVKNKKTEETSTRKRWKFVVLGLLFGYFGIHLVYAKRWFLFLLLWAAFIIGGMMSGGKGESGKPAADAATTQIAESADSSKKAGDSPIGGIGFAVWGLLWIGGTLFIKKDGKGNRM